MENRDDNPRVVTMDVAPVVLSACVANLPSSIKIIGSDHGPVGYVRLLLAVRGWTGSDRVVMQITDDGPQRFVKLVSV